MLQKMRMRLFEEISASVISSIPFEIGVRPYLLLSLDAVTARSSELPDWEPNKINNGRPSLIVTTPARICD